MSESKRPRLTRWRESLEASKAETDRKREQSRADTAAIKAERDTKISGIYDDAARKAAKLSGVETDGALFVGHSHEDGRNATVVLWPNRIERVKPRRFGSVSKANQDVEVTPIKQVTSVQAEKDGFRFTRVTVFAAGNTIEFRLVHNEATRFRQAIMDLILE
jgi:hypothetical protein